MWRRAIIERLTKGTATVGELAAPFALSLPTITRHLDVLERAQLIVRERDAQRRVCRLRRDSLSEANTWMQQYVSFWKDSLESLAAFVTAEEDKAPKAQRKKKVRA